MSGRQLPELGKTSKEFRKLRYFDSLFFFLGGAINSARSFVTSWLSELTQSSSEQNEEETGEGKAPEEKSEAKIDEEKNAGLQEWWMVQQFSDCTWLVMMNGAAI